VSSLDFDHGPNVMKAKAALDVAKARQATAKAKEEASAEIAQDFSVKAGTEMGKAQAYKEGFYKAKLQTARFYFQRILPRTRTHVDSMMSGADNLMDMAEEDFALGY